MGKQKMRLSTSLQRKTHVHCIYSKKFAIIESLAVNDGIKKKPKFKFKFLPYLVFKLFALCFQTVIEVDDNLSYLMFHIIVP